MASLVLFNSIGYVLIYFWADEEQESAFNGITHLRSSQALLSYSFDRSDLKNGDLVRTDDHEWMIRGELFDVVSIVEQNDKITFTCYRDKSEELVKNAMEKNLASQTGTPDGKQKNSSKADPAGKNLKYFSFNRIIPFSSEKNTFLTWTNTVFKTHAAFSGIESPPPQFSSQI